MAVVQPPRLGAGKLDGSRGHLVKPRTHGDREKLWEQAEVLRGRPIPGVRLTERQFEAWADEEVNSEWVNGEVILLSPANLPHIDLNVWLAGLLRLIVEQEDAGRVLMEPQGRLAG